jgi:antitoxin (DNA-binding transcriptional repressor) of toxin-antitoxin stability system
MMKVMAVLRVTEAELASDIHAVLAKVREGVEVIVEQDHRPVAVIRLPHRSGRPISEVVRQAKERNSRVTLDPDFGKDLEAIIASHRQPWNPPSWE